MQEVKRLKDEVESLNKANQDLKNEKELFSSEVTVCYIFRDFETLKHHKHRMKI